MSIELTRCPSCKLFVSLRGYDRHIMRCDRPTSFPAPPVIAEPPEAGELSDPFQHQKS
jgi:hypothetical protein